MVRCQLIYLDLDVHLRGFRAVLHDPEIYPDPEEFNASDFSTMTGPSKRICPGREFAEAALFIVASSVVSVFNLAKAKDENGDDIPVRVAKTSRNGLLR
jgi:cytochrome P450